MNAESKSAWSESYAVYMANGARICDPQRLYMEWYVSNGLKLLDGWMLLRLAEPRSAPLDGGVRLCPM